VSQAGGIVTPMELLFDREPMRHRSTDVWPPRDRDPGDVAVLATRLLAASGRVETALSRLARERGVDRYVVRMLLLFTEANRPLRIGNIADRMGVPHSTASRAVSKARAAGLVTKIHATDGRECDIRLTMRGRAAIERCLTALRPDAAIAFRLGRERTAHPRAAELAELLGAPDHLERSSNGYRAGVVAGFRE
jgi:DNA-binding MarR family transcriptional regulator